MRRHTATPRPDHERIVQEQGLVYNTIERPDGSTRLFWNESAYYSFSIDEIMELERVTQELHEKCLETVEYVITKRRYRDFQIPEAAWPSIERTWEEDSPSLYGRFDLRYDGKGPAKLLEYNADTPTALLEAAVIQWYWLEETQGGRDQWNSLHERLVACWKRHTPRLPNRRVHFAYTEEETTGEDLMTVTYLRETANQAGLSTETLSMEQIGWDHGRESLCRCGARADHHDLQALPVGMAPRRSFRAARLGDDEPDAVDRADLEMYPRQQGAARPAVGALPEPPEPAPGIPAEFRLPDLLCPQADPRA